MSKTLRTGQVAEQAGVNVETLRYYERRGLLKEPARRSSGYREYPLEAVRVVRFIKRSQELGFTLGEIEELLVLREGEGLVCAEAQATATRKIKEIEEKIKNLRAMKNALGILVKTCESQNGVRECPILDALDEKLQNKAT